MRLPPRSRTRKPGPPDKRAAATVRRIHCRRLRSAISRKDWCRRRGLRASCSDDDRLSALTDDLLLLILRRVDTRTALATAALSKRWACLPRGLGSLDFRVGDILPPRYHHCIRAHREAARYTYGLDVNLKAICASIERYQRRAMRAMAASIRNFLDADDDDDRDSGALGPRSVSKLTLEFFAAQCSTSGINRLIAKAVDSWGVEDLEVSAQSMFRRRDTHSFSRHGLCNDPHKSRLRSLKLTAYYFPPLEGFLALNSLVLQDLPKSTPTSAYESIFTLCPQLQSLHLKSCMLDQGVVAVDAPRSEIKQLIMEDCSYGLFKLHALPMLERMAIVDTTVIYRLSSFPYLRHFSLTKCHGFSKSRTIRFTPNWDLDRYIGGSSGIINLVVRFTGYDRWFKPWSPALLLPKLRRLLIADVPSSWDVSWPRLLIEAAPCLESLYIHISPWEEDPCDGIAWRSPKFSHNQLKELVIVGFEGTERQVCFVNFVIKVSTSLQLVSLYKKGHVQDMGRWDWDMVTQRYEWDEEEKVKLLNHIVDNFPCAATPIQIILQ